MNKLVYVSTSSDIIHEGILNVIEVARSHGDVVVGVLSDEVVASYKRRPLLDVEARRAVFGNLKGVQRTVEQKTLSYADILRELRPDYVVHGDDWRSGVQNSIRTEVIDVLSEWGGELIEVPYTKCSSFDDYERNLRERYGSPDARRPALRELIRLKRPVRIIEASNGLSGLIAEKASVVDQETGAVRSFDGFWVSSLCDSTFKGKPDIELVDFTSRQLTIEELMEVTYKPIIFDGDTGGKIEHFVHNVKTLERLGVSAVIVEDKTGLKRNSLYGTDVPQTQEDAYAFAEKLAAGKRALQTRDFMIIARIESLIAGSGMEDALERADIYIKKGYADGIMIHSRERDGQDILEFMRLFREKWPEIPLVLVPTSYNQFTDDELAQAGANIIIYANHLLRAAYVAMDHVATSILENRRAYEADQTILPIKDVLALIPET